jgi:ribosome biogenesis GTPase
MTVEDLGYNEALNAFRVEHKLEAFEVGRVIAEHKERYLVKTPEQEFNAELIGNLRFTGSSRYDFPAVGDWVAFSEYDDDKALIHAIYPRNTIIERQAVGKSGQIQIIATNIDYGLIVQAVDRDFNLNRLERYLTICHTAQVEPLIVLSKVDLVEESELAAIIDQVEQRISNIDIITVSNQLKGYADLENQIKKGKTYCLLGSSGVGKSTILNNLAGREEMKTGEISSSVNKGKHTTSHRELIVLDNGGILIDNPGMREVGMTDATDGLALTFDVIYEYAQQCKFKDCTHTQENGCAVLMALEEGEIDEDAYENFRKMEKEKSHFASNAHERRKKDKKFGKLIKNVLKHKRNTKY